MQLGDIDNHHCNQSRETCPRSHNFARSISRWAGKILQSPLGIVLLVWGFLFLVLSVALACAQESGHDIDRWRAAACPEREGRDKKTEAVEIFGVGEDLVVQPQAPAVKASSRRHRIAARRRARR